MKKKKKTQKPILSFGTGDHDDDIEDADSTLLKNDEQSAGDSDAFQRVRPNKTLGSAPRAMTKSALAKEAQAREDLRREFLLVQEAVKETDILIPFVFYDGSSTPGGTCRMKKGDQIWLFLDKARKVGAGIGSDKSKREWARVGIDDLMLVRDDLVIPHVRTNAVSEVRLIRRSITTFITSSSTRSKLHMGQSSPIRTSPRLLLRSYQAGLMRTIRCRRGTDRPMFQARRMQTWKAMEKILRSQKSLTEGGSKRTNTSIPLQSGETLIPRKITQSSFAEMRMATITLRLDSMKHRQAVEVFSAHVIH